jgi:hypothetical protein
MGLRHFYLPSPDDWLFLFITPSGPSPYICVEIAKKEVMKKLIYVLAVALFNGNISAQREEVNLVPLSYLSQEEQNSTGQTFIFTSTHCFSSHHIKDIDHPKNVFPLELNLENYDMSVAFSRPVETRTFSLQDIQQIQPIYCEPDFVGPKKKAPAHISLITISQEDIKRIPSTMGENDIKKALDCSGIVCCTDKSLEDINIIIGGLPGQFNDITANPSIETKKLLIKGTIKDKDENPAMANVIISGANLRNGFTGVQTDDEGVFGIMVPAGTYTIKITQQGHRDYVGDLIVETDKNIGTIHLKENPIELPNCEFKTYGIICSSSITITREEIRLMANDIILEDTEDKSNESTPGPNTSLEGHNFSVEPAIIYPNPVKDILNVKSTDPITVIEILNAHGQIEMALDPREQMIVTDLPAGIYYARIIFETKKDVQVEKILIVK